MAGTMQLMDVMLGDAYTLAQFRDLPRPYQLSMVFYMAIDGESWLEPFEDLLNNAIPHFTDQAAWHAYCNGIVEDHLPTFVELYGDQWFGISEIETNHLLEHLVASLNLEGEDTTFEKFHHDMVRTKCSPFHAHSETDRRPVILSDFDNEVMQDGFHRLGTYVQQGAQQIPAIFYPKSRHFEAKAIPQPEAELRRWLIGGVELDTQEADTSRNGIPGGVIA